jgi:exoribonuclease R
MNKIVVHIANNTYDSWYFTQDEIKIDIPNLIPSKHKLFNGDVIRMNDFDIIICESVVRDSMLAGVLILNTGKTYGRYGKKLLYKCIPDNRLLPAFLVPYEIPPSFSKATKNRYIVFSFDNWDEAHPLGEIRDTIGEVDSPEAFFEYQLCRKKLNIPISHLTQTARSLIKRDGNDEAIYIQKIMNKYRVEDCRNNKNIFSIDPDSCTDFDDAFSVDFEDGYATVNVYIANVYVWLETYGLWSHLTNRVSTIYLPDKKRPMLPSLLSDTLCSLKEGCDRFAFMMSVKYDMDTKTQVGETVYKNAVIRVNKNYMYEDRKLGKNPGYKALKTLAMTEDSHDVVAFWMIKMNTECAEYLKQKGCGIFRSTCQSKQQSHKQSNKQSDEQSECDLKSVEQSVEQSHDPKNQTIRDWLGNNGSSAIYSEIASPHTQLGVESYVHITSPIRRLVDILNQIQFMKLMDVNITAECQTFLEKWLGKLDDVNRSTKDIRKVQLDCELLAACVKNQELVNKTLSGVVFDRYENEYGYFEYMVYIEELKLMSQIKMPTYMENFVEKKFRIFIFNDEHLLCKKIRLQMD